VRRLVLDASAVGEYLLSTPPSRAVSMHLSRGETLHVPALCDLEVTAGLARATRANLISHDRAQAALAQYVALRLRRHGHRVLMPRIWALRANFSIYDASYVALAERLAAPLVTLDRRLAAAVARHVPGVELVL
jgi:predicted nucleic acid-binding protein